MGKSIHKPDLLEKKQFETLNAKTLPTFFDDDSDEQTEVVIESAYTELSHKLMKQHL